ncbi:hypothetical protein [Burkholderia cepacia]|uniref:hypothetical protein n=1 Tax=Burkholderia cepacia TaxID=292 RepID=UPI00158E0A5A|nr:hypothetical protein [Burkholderia cepacia]
MRRADRRVRFAAVTKVRFETVSRFSEHERQVVRELLDAIIVKNQVAGAIARVTTGPANEKASA